MSDVSVELNELKKQFAAINLEASELDFARKKLLQQYKQVGTNWNDAKYKVLGSIITECNSALLTIEKTLRQGQKDLLKIMQVVEEYESTNISGSGSQQTSSDYSYHFTGPEEHEYPQVDKPMTLHLTPEEVNNRWQINRADIDEQIDNYREALMNRGVPPCAWLEGVLAHHKSAMVQQEGYDLDLASGHISPEDYNPTQYYQYPGNYTSFYDNLAAEFVTFCLEGTNPNYNDSATYRDNCQRCVPTYELRRRGVEAEAHPSSFGSDHLAYYPFDVWDNPHVLSTRGSGLDDIRSEMQSWGDGARAQIVCLWDDGFGTDGHTFMAEQRNGETVFFDPQMGNSNAIDYFDDVVPNSTQFCRIDDLQTTDYINDCCFERSST